MFRNVTQIGVSAEDRLKLRSDYPYNMRKHRMAAIEDEQDTIKPVDRYLRDVAARQEVRTISVPTIVPDSTSFSGLAAGVKDIDASEASVKTILDQMDATAPYPDFLPEYVEQMRYSKS